MDNKIWYTLNDVSCNEFVLHMLSLGKPVEVTLVGAFESEGRGSQRDIELPFHRDGDYSKKKDKMFNKNVDIVGLYCIKGGNAKTLIKVDEVITELVLEENQGLVFDNMRCLHGRKGIVGDRVLLRIWIERFIPLKI
tara:strand:+ start:973 stop:1383 length:411 start_codon:yes stop_codon:yes gene_type:complete